MPWKNILLDKFRPTPIALSLIAVIIIISVLLIPLSDARGVVVCGDANQDMLSNVGDVVYIIAYIFKEGPSPEPICACDGNGDGMVNIGDAVYLISWIFRGGSAPDCLVSGEFDTDTYCKLLQYDPADPLASSTACIEYEYDGQGHLSITHTNAGFNCCPGELAVDISVEGNIITLTESEEDAMCDCNCLFDLDIDVYFLDPGEYTIRVIEPYLPEGAVPFDFAVDFTDAISGSRCLLRDGYPWGETSDPGGSVSQGSFCKDFEKDGIATVPDCIEWFYNGDSYLTLKHTNAAFNCCPEEFTAEYIFEGNTIIINEGEVLEGGGCNCLCLYDVNHNLTGILPGQYTIRVNGPYVYNSEDQIEFIVNLIETPRGIYCIPRDEYPWGY